MTAPRSDRLTGGCIIKLFLKTKNYTRNMKSEHFRVTELCTILAWEGIQEYVYNDD